MNVVGKSQIEQSVEEEHIELVGSLQLELEHIEENVQEFVGEVFDQGVIPQVFGERVVGLVLSYLVDMFGTRFEALDIVVHIECLREAGRLLLSLLQQDGLHVLQLHLKGLGNEDFADETTEVEDEGNVVVVLDIEAAVSPVGVWLVSSLVILEESEVVDEDAVEEVETEVHDLLDFVVVVGEHVVELGFEGEDGVEVCRLLVLLAEKGLFQEEVLEHQIDGEVDELDEVEGDSGKTETSFIEVAHYIFFVEVVDQELLVVVGHKEALEVGVEGVEHEEVHLGEQEVVGEFVDLVVLVQDNQARSRVLDCLQHTVFTDYFQCQLVLQLADSLLQF